MRFEGNYKKIERIVKGFSNHRRIEIMELLYKEPELSLNEISEKLNVNLKTLSEHLRKMAISGIVLKRYEGIEVRHRLSQRGEKILQFLKNME